MLPLWAKIAPITTQMLNSCVFTFIVCLYARENLFSGFAINIGANQPAHPGSLISALGSAVAQW